jgi:hypothetical protein
MRAEFKAERPIIWSKVLAVALILSGPAAVAEAADAGLAVKAANPPHAVIAPIAVKTGVPVLDALGPRVRVLGDHG